MTSPRATLGIDEAGRGPVLGPLVLAGVCLRPAAAAALTRAGVADSKRFGSHGTGQLRRAALAARLRDAADSVVVRVVDVEEIDLRVRLHELNHLEREHAEVIISRSAPCGRIVADGARLFSPLRERHPTLEARDRAEQHHVAVAAASIVAKTRRDELFACISRRYAPAYGPLAGGGYENPATHRFLRAYVARHGHLPPEARRAWSWAGIDYLPAGYDPLADLPPVGQLALVLR